MSKTSSESKRLIRNPSIPVKSSVNPEQVKKSKKVHFLEPPPDRGFGETNAFIAPEFSTVLQLRKAVDDLRNSKFGPKCSNDGFRYKNVNFTPEEKLFQDLIDVSLPTEHSKRHCQNHNCVNTNFKKDPDPIYEKLITYPLSASYTFTHSLKPSIRKEKVPYYGISLHESITNWDAL